MGWFSQILGADSAGQDRYIDDWLRGIERGLLSATGLRVTVEEALRVPGISACIQVQAEDLAKVPLELKRRTDDGFEPATDHPLYGVLKFGPSPWLPGVKWRRAMVHGVLARGNHYSRVWRSEAGRVEKITPIQKGRTTQRWADDGEPFFDVAMMTGMQRGLTYQDVIHVAYRDSDDRSENGGIIGVSPIMQNKETVALMIAAERFAGVFFANGAQPSMILEYDKKLPNDEVAKRIREGIERVYGGLENKWKVAILELGMKLRETSSDPAKSQLIETRKYGAEQACMMYRTPPHKIGLLERSTNNNIEQQSIDFVTGPISGLAKAVEEAMSVALFTTQERDELKIEHNLEGLMRGDMLSRYRAYAIGRQWGWLSADDVRVTENRNKLPNAAGETYLTPLNMVPAGEDPRRDDPANDRQPPPNRAASWSPTLFAAVDPKKMNGVRPPRRLASIVGPSGEPVYVN